MKKIISRIAFSMLVLLSAVSLAQSGSQKKEEKKNTDIPLDKQKVVAPDKKDAAEFAGPELKSDKNNYEYKIVNGRKVMVDNRGVQSLAVPDAKNTVASPEEKKNEVPVK